MGNYFEKETTTVTSLMHFPYSSFSDFQKAISKGEIVDIGIPMDHARSWAMQANNAPKTQQIIKIILMVAMFLLPLFYIVSAFVIHNYWLILFAVVPFVVSFTGSPMARRIMPVHWLLIIGLGLTWFISGNFPHPIYWLPIFLQYKVFDYLYKNSAQLVRQVIQQDQELLCLFWKHWGLTLYTKDGDEHDQRFVKKNGQTEHFDDVQEEWEAYLELRKHK